VSISFSVKAVDIPLAVREYMPLPSMGQHQSLRRPATHSERSAGMPCDLVVQKIPSGRRVELQIDGLVVSWAVLFYLKLRIGTAVLRFGGIGGVSTHREHRKRGYSRRVMTHCLDAMTGEGNDLSMLFGIPNFYHKFGFRTSLSDYRIDLPGRHVVDGPLELVVRKLPKSRHAEILPLYARGVRARGFGIERPPATWTGYRRGAMFRQKPLVAAFYRRERMVGYLQYDDDHRAVRVGELWADSPAVIRQMFTWLGRQCRGKVCEQIELMLPPDHPAGRMAVEVGATLARTTHPNGGGMMRILDLGSTLAALMPELARRWAASPMADSGVDLSLVTDIGTAEIALPARAAGGPTLRGRVRLPQSRLVQLLVGYMPVADVAAADGVGIPRKLLPALDILLPERCPSILSVNCF
jgi:GNAT superfamily N-acetyltransferase